MLWPPDKMIEYGIEPLKKRSLPSQWTVRLRFYVVC